MKIDRVDLVLATIGAITCIILSAGISHTITKERLQERAISEECARFNPNTAKFEWITLTNRSKGYAREQLDSIIRDNY
jgi:hypothetical protein